MRVILVRGPNTCLLTVIPTYQYILQSLLWLLCVARKEHKRLLHKIWVICEVVIRTIENKKGVTSTCVLRSIKNKKGSRSEYKIIKDKKSK